MTTRTRTTKRSVDGIFLLNKPIGLSSNHALQRVKRFYQAEKAGHSGTLDPMATGMLPVCFGEATKFCQYLLDADKCYEVTAELGVTTTTGDAMGEVVSTVQNFEVIEEALRTVVSQFIGDIQQVPSMYSALKHQGKPLYQYARAGIEIERPARTIRIHDITHIKLEGNSFSLLVSCSKGTYIRTLVEDIGQKLGVGAHVTRLHRVTTAGFRDEPMYELDTLIDKETAYLQSLLLPVDRAVGQFPELVLSETQVTALFQGRVLSDASRSEEEGDVRLYDVHKHFLGLGSITEDAALKAKRLIKRVE